jgi:hypothetical protein
MSNRPQKATVTVVAAALLMFGLSLVLPASSASRAGRSPIVRIEVRGAGEVLGGRRACRRVCLWSVPVGREIRLHARARAWTRFDRWAGSCTGVADRCLVRLGSGGRVVLATFRSAAVHSSWNTHVRCRAVRTSITTILGDQASALGGAIEAGGGFQPHLAGPADKRLLNPPCAVGGVPTFVEIDGVTVAEQPEHSSDGDWVVNLTSKPAATQIPMATIHVEEDNAWISAGVAPPLLPPMGTKIDVQGFVFWDPEHVTAAYHSFSGWELHALSAWRLARR